MPEGKSDQQERSQLLEKTPDTWDNDASRDVPPLANAELVQLQVRVIALENLLIALLAEASVEQRKFAREMATYISPRQGYTPHSLTLHAATQMVHLVERGEFFRVDAQGRQTEVKGPSAVY